MEDITKLKKLLLSEGRLKDSVRYMKLLSHPTRIQILRLLSKKELCVCFIEKIVGKTQPNISQHLTKLRDSGVIEGYQKGKFTFYRISDKKVLDIIKNM